LMALLFLYGNLKEVRVWSRTKQTRDAYIAEMKPKCDETTKMIPVSSAKDAVKGADIVVTTTPSRKPIVSREWFTSGMHFNCIGADAPGKQELDPMILKRAKIVVDDWEQASHGGEINVPLAKGIISKENIWAEIGEVVSGLKPGRASSDEVTVFVSTGLAVQDAATAHLVYKKALAKKIGQLVEIV